MAEGSQKKGFDVRTNVFNSEFSVSLKSIIDGKDEPNKEVTIETRVMPFGVDVSVLNQSEIDEILRNLSRKNVPLDLKIRVSSHPEG